MKIYRSKLEIVAKLLDTARTGTTKTQMMYDGYLSWAQQKKYLIFLQDCALIEYDDVDNLYRTTEKGLEFLSHAVHLSNLMGGPIENLFESSGMS